MVNNSTPLIGDIHTEEAGPEVAKVLEICADVKDGKFEMAALERGLPLPYAKPIDNCPRYAGANLTHWDISHLDCVSKFEMPIQAAALLVVGKDHCDVALKCTSKEQHLALKDAVRLHLDLEYVVGESVSDLSALSTWKPNTIQTKAFNAGIPICVAERVEVDAQIEAFKILKPTSQDVMQASQNALHFYSMYSVKALELTKDIDVSKNIVTEIQFKALQWIHSHNGNINIAKEFNNETQLKALEAGIQVNLALLGSVSLAIKDGKAMKDALIGSNVTEMHYQAMSKCSELYFGDASAMNEWQLEVLPSSKCNFTLANLFKIQVKRDYLASGGSITVAADVEHSGTVLAHKYLYSVHFPMVKNESQLLAFQYSHQVWRVLRNLTSIENATMQHGIGGSWGDYLHYHLIEKPFGYERAAQVWANGIKNGVKQGYDHFWNHGSGYIGEDWLHWWQWCSTEGRCGPMFGSAMTLVAIPTVIAAVFVVSKLAVFGLSFCFRKHVPTLQHDQQRRLSTESVLGSDVIEQMGSQLNLLAPVSDPTN